MGGIHDPARVLFVIAVSSRHGAALEWARQRCVEHYGPVSLASAAFDFIVTDYYTATMGSELKKQFFAFERPLDPAALASIKCATNQWEAEYAALRRHAEPRPLNLDPGYITPAKLVLASTKDHAHRLYLRDGIYAEVTLAFRQRQWQPLEWTYPDYRRDDYQQFFTQCREWLLNCGWRGEAVK
ncbi:MAG: DUF4416 family protein [Pirellulales bacterium]